jgi:hypothetical protein
MADHWRSTEPSFRIRRGGSSRKTSKSETFDWRKVVSSVTDCYGFLPDCEYNFDDAFVPCAMIINHISEKHAKRILSDDSFCKDVEYITKKIQSTVGRYRHGIRKHVGDLYDGTWDIGGILAKINTMKETVPKCVVKSFVIPQLIRDIVANEEHLDESKVIELLECIFKLPDASDFCELISQTNPKAKMIIHFNDSPLHWAMWNGYVDVVYKFLEMGYPTSMISEKNKYMETVFDLAEGHLAKSLAIKFPGESKERALTLDPENRYHVAISRLTDLWKESVDLQKEITKILNKISPSNTEIAIKELKLLLENFSDNVLKLLVTGIIMCCELPINKLEKNNVMIAVADVLLNLPKEKQKKVMSYIKKEIQKRTLCDSVMNYDEKIGVIVGVCCHHKICNSKSVRIIFEDILTSEIYERSIEAFARFYAHTGLLSETCGEWLEKQIGHLKGPNKYLVRDIQSSYEV